jgi:hypothetical protein
MEDLKSIVTDLMKIEKNGTGSYRPAKGNCKECQGDRYIDTKTIKW